MPSLSEIAQELEQPLPSAVLLLGDSQETLARLAGQAFRHHGVSPADLVLVTKLTSPIAHDIGRLAWVVPWGKFKAFEVALDGSTVTAQNRLLKTLEESPTSAAGTFPRFILFGTSDPVPPIVSRCRVLRVSGEPHVGLRLLPEAAAGKAAAAVQAAKTGDPQLLCDVLASGWDDDCTEALFRWAAGRCTNLPAPGTPLTERKRARAVMQVITAHPKARPVNVAMAALSVAFLEE